MIAVEKRDAVERMGPAMAKLEARHASAERHRGGVVGDPPERDDRRKVRHFRNGGAQEIAAMGDLLAVRLVFGRHAAHRIGDAGVAQRKPVVRAGEKGAARKAEVEKGRVEEIAGVIAGERPPRPIGTLQPRRKADDQEPCLGRPE